MTGDADYISQLHAALRRFCIIREHRNTFLCLLCFKVWRMRDPEVHEPSCLAAPNGERT